MELLTSDEVPSNPIELNKILRAKEILLNVDADIFRFIRNKLLKVLTIISVSAIIPFIIWNHIQFILYNITTFNTTITKFSYLYRYVNKNINLGHTSRFVFDSLRPIKDRTKWGNGIASNIIIYTCLVSSFCGAYKRTLKKKFYILKCYITSICTTLNVLSYLYHIQEFVDKVIIIKYSKSNEMVRLLENRFRAVNIGLVNEMVMISDG